MRVSKRLFEVHATIKMNSFMDNIDIKLLLFVVIAAVFIKKTRSYVQQWNEATTDKSKRNRLFCARHKIHKTSIE